MPIKSVPITLDKKRQLRFDFNAFCALEDELGISIADLGSLFGFTGEQMEIPDSPEELLKVARKIKLKNMRAVLWAGLIHEDSTLTVMDVGAFIDMGSLSEIFEKVVEALNAAFPTAEETPEKKVTEPERKSGTGKSISEKPTK